MAKHPVGFKAPIIASGDAITLQKRAISAAAPTDGQVLAWDVTEGNWESAGATPPGGEEYGLTVDTTNAALTEMLTAEATQLVMPNNTTWYFEVRVVGRRTDVDADNAVYLLSGGISRDANAASTALIGDVNVIVDEVSVAWNVVVSADAATGALKVSVQGEVGKNVSWVANVQIVEISE